MPPAQMAVPGAYDFARVAWFQGIGGTGRANQIALIAPAREQGWRTRKRKHGRTQWIPPPHLDTGQARVNKYHHPQEFLLPDDDETAC